MGEIKTIQRRGLFTIFCISCLVQFFVSADANEINKDLTPVQKQAFEKFKARVVDRVPHDYMREDIYLLRWLRAKNFNVEQAEQFLNDNLKWRKANKIDTILQEDWTEFQEKHPYYLDTKAKDGKPILTGNFGDWDIRALSLAGKMPMLIRYLSKGLEDAVTLVRKPEYREKNVTQFDFLMNMDNYNLIQHGCLQCIHFYLSLVNTYENHYPGTANHIILFNTPPVFKAVLHALKPLVSPITREAFRVYGQDREQWSKELLQWIDKDQLPPEAAGTHKRKE